MIRARLTSARHAAQELYELGPVRTAFRIGWELRLRSRWFELTDRPVPRDETTLGAVQGAAARWGERRILTSPEIVARTIRPHLAADDLAALRDAAHAAARGEITLFSHARVACGDPIAWHRDPFTGQTLDASRHWSRALGEVEGDVKSFWEPARFPHAYAMGRAATFFPEDRPVLARAMRAQIESFIDANPYARGVHWASGQEIAFRLFAFTFAFHTLLDDADDRFLRRLAAHFYESGVHIARHIDYARFAVHNNHLVSEATGLLLVAHLLPEAPRAADFRRTGMALLDEAIASQFYPDGGYIQQSHNYHRVALQDLSWAFAILRASRTPLPPAWRDAASRSLDFLRAQQAPDGRLPNYGNNDGALVSPLSSAEYADFRPALGAIAAATRGAHIYAPGPWDEEGAWFTTSNATATATATANTTTSFDYSGFHLLRGEEPGSFAVFRCGTLHDRFTQIDMLHLDVFWRGRNVLVDAGTYRYAGAPELHAHFLGTSSHNTVMVGGEEQMLHHRRFKTLYPARAEIVARRSGEGWALVAGEHHGYQRVFEEVVHRRAVLSVRGELWVVVDTISGRDAVASRLQWLLGPGLETGPFTVEVFDGAGAPMHLDLARGVEDPPRGWLSRRYAEKVAVTSIHVTQTARVATFVSVLGAGPVSCTKEGARWTASAAGARVAFVLEDGVPAGVTT